MTNQMFGKVGAFVPGPITITIVHPLADLRPFLPAVPGPMARPAWPNPIIHRDFLRSFGGAIPHPEGGVQGWIGESKVARIENAMKLAGWNITAQSTRLQSADTRVASRFLFADKGALRSVQINLEVRPRRRRISDQAPEGEAVLYPPDLSEVLSTPTTIRALRMPNVPELATRIDNMPCLLELGPALSRAYHLCTVNVRDGHIFRQKWLEYCDPAVVVLYPIRTNADKRMFMTFLAPRKSFSTKLRNTNGVRIGRFLLRGRRGLQAVWTVSYPSTTTLQDYLLAKLIRRYLIRLQAERSVLGIVLARMGDGDLSLAGASADALSSYLEHAVRRLTGVYNVRGRRVTTHFQEHPAAAWVRDAEDAAEPGAREGLLFKLEDLMVTHPLARRAVMEVMMAEREYEAQAGARSAVQQVTNVWINQLKGALEMSNDTFHFNKSNVGQAGRHNTQESNVNQLATSTNDPAVIADELGRLLEALRSGATKAGHFQAAGSIAEAADAAAKPKFHPSPPAGTLYPRRSAGVQRLHGLPTGSPRRQRGWRSGGRWAARPCPREGGASF